MSKNISIQVSLNKYTPESIRYAAHSLGGAAYALLKPLPGGRVLVELTPKSGAGAGLARRFRAELEDEKLRERVASENRELREFMLLKALTWRPRPQEKDDAGLTPQQEKELNDLIAQIETEIKAEATGAPSADPLGITSTWEDKYDNKKRAPKKR
ncbi:MAG TPA: hypothetical protein DEQ38_05625 [Elusimicrobia bacterium]|nr:MAG: hypothetical protein A2089_13330 [Elusimicrobia bacterium GWD2_63_28]HCC47580.1 hypothetical protein [Elusimicrobiota bacterium]